MNLASGLFFHVLPGTALAIGACCAPAATAGTERHDFQIPKVVLESHNYVIYKTADPIKIDGKLDEHAWRAVRWTTSFVNITGHTNNPPAQKAKVKLLWSDEYLYVGIRVRERNVWATVIRHDGPLYFQNLCEIFIDPDGDTQNYLELGVNALGTTYDLLLTRPYRDGGHNIRAYNILGLKVGVAVDGTVNNPKDVDTGWTAEIAIPMTALRQLNLLGGQKPPASGDQWRVQFARSERQLAVVDGKYTLKTDPTTGKPLAPTYSSWSPQGLVNLHYPEMWGFIQFSDILAGHGKAKFKVHRYDRVKWLLRRVYYHEKRYHFNHASYSDSFAALNVKEVRTQKLGASLQIHATRWTFLATLPGTKKGAVWLINQNGKIWREHL